MSKKSSIFYQKYGKRIFDLFLVAIGIIFLWPIFIVIGILIKLDSSGPIIFKQKRTGKNGKPFTIYKFRTMIKGAEKLQEKYCNLNEVDGPVFKIKNDPRFTKVGKVLSHTGLDELPQILNIFKREMSFVGPRPLPINEENGIPTQFRKIRKKVMPGLISSWLLKGGHSLSFKQWMELDLEDIKNGCFPHDLKIVARTFFTIIKMIKQEFKTNK